MRILQLIPQCTLGGAEIFAYRLSRELAHRGHEVLLLANRRNGPLFEGERPPGMRVLALDRTSRLDPRIVGFLVGSIRRFRPDILHSHNFEANTWARALGLIFPRLIVMCHEHGGRKIHQPRHRAWLDRILYRRCSGVFVVNQELGTLLRTRHRVPADLLHVLPNGIDIEHFTRQPDWPRHPHGVVCVASLTDVKNHAGLLQAWKEVQQTCPEARLTLVGEGPLRPELEQQAHKDGTYPSITFAGLQNDIRPFLWSNSIFVLFSHREALPLSLLEAMASELACVAPDVGGIGEALEHGASGHLVPPGDHRALAGVLLKLLQNPEERQRLGRRARREVERAYGLKTCVDRMEAVYREALNPRGARSSPSRNSRSSSP